MENKLSELFKPPHINEAKRVLCVQPHGDDNEIGMGATIRKLYEKGCEIHYLTVTDGRLGNYNPSQSFEKTVQIRKEEVKSAGKVLGASHFHFFDYKDGSLEGSRELSYKVAELIRKIKSDFVFVCDPFNSYEAHLDHIYVGRAVSQAVVSSSLAFYPENTKTSPFEVTALGYYFTNIPNTYVDMTKYLDHQFSAMAKHESQLSGSNLEMIKAYLTNQYKNYAVAEGGEYAQGFKLLRPIQLHCVTEANNI